MVRVVVAGGIVEDNQALAGLGTRSNARAKMTSISLVKDADMALTQLAAGDPPSPHLNLAPHSHDRTPTRPRPVPRCAMHQLTTPPPWPDLPPARARRRAGGRDAGRQRPVHCVAPAAADAPLPHAGRRGLPHRDQGHQPARL